jgi:hypothetical protein
MNSASLPFLETALSCSPILCSGVPVRALMSARNLPARKRLGSRRWERRECVLEQTLGLWISGRCGELWCERSGRRGTLRESRRGCSGPQASNGLRLVGRRGASSMVCHTDSNVMYMGAMCRRPET